MKRKGCYDCCKDVVHPDREYSICLDCLIKKLIKEHGLDMPVWYKNTIYYDEEEEGKED